MTAKALDVSNYSGYCDFSEAVALGYSHVVVRLSTETSEKRDIAIHQLRNAQDRGMSTSGYVWPYFSMDATDLADRCMQVAVEAGVPLRRVWLDLEEPDPPAWYFSWANEFYAGLGADQPAGIYTSPGWWGKHGSAAAAFRGKRRRNRVPLWLAHYDGVAKLRDVYMPMHPWVQLAAKQWQGTTTVGGVLADLNVFNRRYT